MSSVRFRLELQTQITLIFILFLLPFGAFSSSKCLYISSYHQGYAWSDGVERGLRKSIGDQCELKQIDMDTKRHKDEAYKQQAAKDARDLILSWKPDVVITADDNAAKYVIKPYFKDHQIPFVFCGINWNVDAYGFPYSNTTGMVEVAPIDVLFNKARSIRIGAERAVYLGADTLTEKKNAARFEGMAENIGLLLDRRLVSTTAEWLAAYEEAQEYDFVIIGSNSGINDWDETEVVDRLKRTTHSLSLTTHNWMMPYSVLGFTKIPEEHGEWAAKAALAILDGVAPTDIPIVSNRKWEIWVNHSILMVSGLKLPDPLVRKAKKIQ
ncbi:MAG: ABC transporter substrate-binding protein [Candidatus Thiodiazotropha sp. 'RUGA']|nr:ABC transporter substrate-binding protein [Candidatus Thiodiazotropha sp. 'RUGA']